MFLIRYEVLNLPFLENQLKNTLAEKPTETDFKRFWRLSRSFLCNQNAVFLIKHEVLKPHFFGKPAQKHLGREAGRDHFQEILEIKQIFQM